MIFKTHVRSVLEYGGDVWQPTEGAALQLEKLQLRAARAVLGCGYDRTLSEAVLAELGLETLEERRRRAHLRWYARLRGMAGGRLPAQVYASSVAGSQRLAWRAGLRALWATAGTTPHSRARERERRRGARGEAPPPAAPPVQLPDIDDLHEQGGRNFLMTARGMLRDAGWEGLQHELTRARTVSHLPHIELYRGRIQPYLGKAEFQRPGTVLKMKCRVGILEVRALLHMRRCVNDARCPLCGDEETVDHFVLHCPAFTEHRTAMFAQLRDLFTSAASFGQFRAQEDARLVACLLSDKYWGPNAVNANRAVCDYLAAAWDDRERLIEAFASQ